MKKISIGRLKQGMHAAIQKGDDSFILDGIVHPVAKVQHHINVMQKYRWFGDHIKVVFPLDQWS